MKNLLKIKSFTIMTDGTCETCFLSLVIYWVFVKQDGIQWFLIPDFYLSRSFHKSSLTPFFQFLVCIFFPAFLGLPGLLLFLDFNFRICFATLCLVICCTCPKQINCLLLTESVIVMPTVHYPFSNLFSLGYSGCSPPKIHFQLMAVLFILLPSDNIWCKLTRFLFYFLRFLSQRMSLIGIDKLYLSSVWIQLRHKVL